MHEQTEDRLGGPGHWSARKKAARIVNAVAARGQKAVGRKVASPAHTTIGLSPR